MCKSMQSVFWISKLVNYYVGLLSDVKIFLKNTLHAFVLSIWYTYMYMIIDHITVINVLAGL